MITIFKFLATLLITNSHFDILYPESLKFLAAGGSLGNSLFFFCSGYTLFFSKKVNFLNWYKRRISRIYPAVFATSMIWSIVYSIKFTFYDLVYPTGAWFITAIMIFYILYYYVLKYYKFPLASILLLLIIPYLFFYFSILDLTMYSIEGKGYFKWIYYFQVVLLGGVVASGGLKLKINRVYSSIGLTLILVSYLVFRLLLGYGYVPMSYQFIMHIIGLFFVYFMYLALDKVVVDKIINVRYLGGMIEFLSGLTLEIYLIQFVFIGNSNLQSIIFPWNIIIVFMLMVLGAYIANQAAKIFVWIFAK